MIIDIEGEDSVQEFAPLHTPNKEEEDAGHNEMQGIENEGDGCRWGGKEKAIDIRITSIL